MRLASASKALAHLGITEAGLISLAMRGLEKRLNRTRTWSRASMRLSRVGRSVVVLGVAVEESRFAGGDRDSFFHIHAPAEFSVLLHPERVIDASPLFLLVFSSAPRFTDDRS